MRTTSWCCVGPRRKLPRPWPRCRQWTAQAGLTLHPVKTRLVHAWNDGFDFLGYHFERGRRWPREKSMGKLKDAIRAKTRRTVGQALPRVIADLNLTLRGWYDYFQHSYRPTFRMVDGWVRRRLRSILRRRQRSKGNRIEPRRRSDALAECLLCQAWAVQLAGRP